jgi:hypothetical protein
LSKGRWSRQNDAQQEKTTKIGLPNVHQVRAIRTIRLRTTIPAELPFANQPPAKEGEWSNSLSRH